MIIDNKHLQLSEREYRKLLNDSYSSIKDFLQSRVRYYKKYILHEKIDETKEQEKEDMRFGNIVDCLKLTPEDFESRYNISTSIKPTGQMLDFVEKLHRLIIRDTNDEGILCANLEHLIEEAYIAVGFKRDKLETIKERFLTKKEGYDYFIELKERGDRIVIESEELAWAQNTVDYMNHHKYTADIMNLQTNNKYEVVYQIMLKGIINSVEVKMMGDIVIFDLQNKVIQPYDLKVMGNNEMFPYNYLRFKYYIQNGVYTTLLKQNFPDFTVNPICFITIDKYKQSDPWIVRTSEKQYQEAMNGFIIDGRKYKGVLQALGEMKWHKESEIWTSSKEVYDNNGFSDLKLNGTEEGE